MFRMTLRLLNKKVLSEPFPIHCYPVNDTKTHHAICDTEPDAHPNIDFVFRYEEHLPVDEEVIDSLVVDEEVTYSLVVDEEVLDGSSSSSNDRKERKEK